MKICKICNENLYKDITFENIFKNNYTVHASCINNLVFNNDRITIPINNNLIYYDYVFQDLNENYNYDYLEMKYMNKLLINNIDKSDWSIIIYYESGLFDSFKDIDLLILFSLSNSPFLIVSLIFHDFSKIFYDEM